MLKRMPALFWVTSAISNKEQGIVSSWSVLMLLKKCNTKRLDQLSNYFWCLGSWMIIVSLCHLNFRIYLSYVACHHVMLTLNSIIDLITIHSFIAPLSYWIFLWFCYGLWFYYFCWMDWVFGVYGIYSFVGFIIWPQ